MSIDRRQTLCLIAASGALGACADRPGGPYMGGPTNFGEANRITMAAQVIDPTPNYSTIVPETSGDHAAEAVTRYRTDKVKRPVSAAKPTLGSVGTTPQN